MADENEVMEDQSQDIIDDIKGRVEQILDRFAEDLEEAGEELREGVAELAEELAKVKTAPSFNEEDVNAAFEDWMGEAGAIPDEVNNELQALRETFIEECRES